MRRAPLSQLWLLLAAGLAASPGYADELKDLYFGEAPFDNPLDYGNFQMACVRAWYNSNNGSKLPAVGRLKVPKSTWKDPQKFNTTYVATGTDAGPKQENKECGSSSTGAKVYCNPGDTCIDLKRNRCKVSVCVCPDGKVGLCF